jgi:tRNA pseudouridine38-40 synthase
VFRRRYCLHLPEALDLEAMRRAAGLLLGEHDFRSFTTAKSRTKPAVRTLQALEVRDHEGWVELHFEGDGFLHNMARILTGTLLEVGAGRLEPEAMAGILEARERGAAGPLAPAQGLCLLEVLY